MNPETLAMLAAMQNGGGESMQQLLAQAPGIDDKTRAVLEMMGNSGADTGSGGNPRQRTRARKRQLLRRAQEAISSLKGQLENAVRIIDLVAEATGACADCFGQDPQCPDCRGQGAPGWLRPEPALYETLIAPVVMRMTAEREHAHATRENAASGNENHPH